MDLTHVRWRKASYSGGNGGGCVEVSATHDTASVPHKADEDLLYLLRDSKDPRRPKLAFTTAEWDAFIAGVKDGEFDPASIMQTHPWKDDGPPAANRRAAEIRSAPTPHEGSSDEPSIRRRQPA